MALDLEVGPTVYCAVARSQSGEAKATAYAGILHRRLLHHHADLRPPRVAQMDILLCSLGIGLGQVLPYTFDNLRFLFFREKPHKKYIRQ